MYPPSKRVCSLTGDMVYLRVCNTKNLRREHGLSGHALFKSNMDAILTQMTLINKSSTEVVSVTIPSLSVWLSNRLEHDYSTIQSIYSTDATNVAVIGSNKSRPLRSDFINISSSNSVNIMLTDYSNLIDNIIFYQYYNGPRDFMSVGMAISGGNVMVQAHAWRNSTGSSTTITSEETPAVLLCFY